MSGECKVDGCQSGIAYRGLCRRHYDHNRVYGDPVLGGGRSWRYDPPEPVVCECPSPTPEHIHIFDAWQCSTCYRKCEAPT